MRIIQLLGAICILTLAGCVSGGTRVSNQQASQFQKGVSTEQDVISKLGNPTSISRAPNGSETITYMFTKSSPDAVDFVPIVGTLVGGASSKQTAVVFSFGPNGKLTGYSTNRTKIHMNTGLAG